MMACALRPVFAAAGIRIVTEDDFHFGAETGGYRVLCAMRARCTPPRLGLRLAPLLDLTIDDERDANLARLADSVLRPPGG